MPQSTRKEQKELTRAGTIADGRAGALFTELCGKFHQLSVENFSIAELLWAHVEIIQKQEPIYKRLISEIAFLPYEMKLSLPAIQSIMSYHFGLVISRGQQSGTIKNIPLHMLFKTWLGLVIYSLRRVLC